MNNSYVYNDAELLVSTQVAYLDVPKGWTVGEYAEYVERVYNSGSETAKSGKFQSQYETVGNLKRIAEENNVSDWESWKVVDVCDNNDKSGMYGCLIDTGYGDAIIGFRGSESFDCPTGIMDSQLVKDWIVADVGMLDSYSTQQQLEASEYTRWVWENYGDKYSSFSLTGHSLGGNLAEHAGFTAPEEMRSHINHTVSFDGPGFSNEYLDLHKKDIEKAKDYTTHYHWSFVGGLLTQPSSVENRVIYAEDDETAEGDILGIPKSQLWRHSPVNVKLKDGYVQDGEQSELMKWCHIISTAADNDWTMRILGMIPIIGPHIRNIDKLHKIASLDRAVGEMTERTLKDIHDVFENILKNVFNQVYSEFISGDFEINISSADCIADEFKDTSVRIRSIAENISDIQRSLKYDSISGSYFKTKIWCICNSIMSDAERTDKLSSALNSICRRYSNSDREVSELYV